MSKKLWYFVNLFFLLAWSPLQSKSFTLFTLAPLSHYQSFEQSIDETLIIRGGRDRNPYGEEGPINRDFDELDGIYQRRISRFLAQLNEQSNSHQPKRILILGIGAGVVPIDLLLAFPNLEIHSTSQEDLILSKNALADIFMEEAGFEIIDEDQILKTAEQLLRKLRKYFRKHDLPQRTPYPDNYFHAVIVTQCLFGYVHGKDHLLNEMIRITNPNGKIFTDLSLLYFDHEKGLEEFRQIPGIEVISGNNVFIKIKKDPPQPKPHVLKRIFQRFLKIIGLGPQKWFPKIILDMASYAPSAKKPIPLNLRDSKKIQGNLPGTKTWVEIYSVGTSMEACL